MLQNRIPVICEMLAPLMLVNFNFLVQTSSPPAIHRISRPPAAAPAVGGRGIDGSRRVYSLGVRGVAAGGAAEEVARSVRPLKMAALFFDLATPVEFRVGSVVFRVSAARGVAAYVIPSPVAVMAAAALTSVGMKLSLTKPADLVGVDGGAVALRFVDHPSVRGSHPVQGCSGGAAEGHAGGACFSSEMKLESRTRAYLYFLCFPGFICKMLG